MSTVKKSLFNSIKKESINMNKTNLNQGWLLYSPEKYANISDTSILNNDKLSYIRYTNKKLLLITKFIERCYSQSLEKESSSQKRYSYFINLLKQSKDIKILESNKLKYTSIRIEIDRFFYHFSYSNNKKSFFDHNITIKSKACLEKVVRFKTMINQDNNQPEENYVNFYLIRFDLDQKDHTQELFKKYNLTPESLILKDDFKQFSDLLLNLEILLTFSKKLTMLEDEFDLNNVVLEKIKSVEEKFDSTLISKTKDELLTFEKKYIIDIYENLKKYASEINNVSYLDCLKKEKTIYFLNAEINMVLDLLDLLTDLADKIKSEKKEINYTRCLNLSFPFNFTTSILDPKERMAIKERFSRNEIILGAIKKIEKTNKEFIQYQKTIKNKSFSIFDEI